MVTDYDSPRKIDDAGQEGYADTLTRRPDLASAAIDVDETELAESLELPGADLSGEELAVRVIPPQPDEFTCSRCFLVRHRSQRVSELSGQQICLECAA
ncbi:DUF4193 domain-containing protein [Nonomuraea bangladeshensis]|uniref:DUF4193 domain-containing protein n=1 Tax=Nonomuraea bangladeshensis TaxID=404385 RepID=UPI003C2ADDBC